MTATHYDFTAVDSIGRPGQVSVRLPDPVNGSQGFFVLDRDPGIGSMYGYRSLWTLTITGGTPEGLCALARWLDQPRPAEYPGDRARKYAVKHLLAVATAVEFDRVEKSREPLDSSWD